MSGFIINPYAFGAEAGGGALICDSADFDGTNDYLQSATQFTGAANSKLLLASIFFRLDGGDAARKGFFGFSDALGYALFFQRNDDGKIQLGARSITTDILTATGTTVLTASGTWHHLAFSVDMADTAKRFVYLDGAAETMTWTTYTNDEINFATGIIDVTLGSRSNGAAFKFNGCLAEAYINYGTYMDLSVAANLQKFRAADGKPVNLGTTGSTPTGSVPSGYFHLDDGETAANFATNRAGNGNLAVNGALDTGSTSPSD